MYAVAEYGEASQLLDRANSQVAAKEYAAARQTAVEAKAKAEEAQKAAEVNLAKAKTDAEAAVANAKSAKDAVGAALTAPELAKATQDERRPIDEAMTAVDGQIAQAESLIPAEDYLKAQEAANAAIASADEAKAKVDALLTALAEKAKGKKKK